MKKYKLESKQELVKLANNENIYLGDIDTSLITDMSGLFLESERRDFSGIETWDVSNVRNMSDLFRGAINFNHNINDWDVSNVENMGGMFYGAEKFNQPLNKWDTSNVEDMSYMFCCAYNFNQNINTWNTSKVETMYSMFAHATNFNQPLDKWDVSKVKNMSAMFCCAYNFNQDLSNWNLSNIENTKNIFYGIPNLLEKNVFMNNGYNSFKKILQMKEIVDKELSLILQDDLTKINLKDRGYFITDFLYCIQKELMLSEYDIETFKTLDNIIIKREEHEKNFFEKDVFVFDVEINKENFLALSIKDVFYQGTMKPRIYLIKIDGTKHLFDYFISSMTNSRYKIIFIDYKQYDISNNNYINETTFKQFSKDIINVLNKYRHYFLNGCNLSTTDLEQLIEKQ